MNTFYIVSCLLHLTLYRLVEAFSSSNVAGSFRISIRSTVDTSLYASTTNVVSSRDDALSVASPFAPGSIGTVCILLPSEGADDIKTKFGSKSPVGNPTLEEAATHLTDKLNWFSDGGVSGQVVKVPRDGKALMNLVEVDALLAFGLSSDADMKFARDVFEKRRARSDVQKHRQCQFGLQCAGPLTATVGPYDEDSVPLQSIIPWTEQATGGRLVDQMKELFDRWSSDDFGVALMLFFNQFSGQSVPWVKHSIDATWEKGAVQNAQEFYNMITKCGDCITKCLADETCKTCIDALNAVDTRDQVMSYRTIVSFESELLKDFSYCILQKNNIFGCHAEIPTLPKVNPILKWRGSEITKESARSILIGHLDDIAAPEGSLGLEVSWKVACGANVAYDQFPSQNQIFYESVNGQDIWYDPVFRVETIDGRNVWCKRHYKVRNGKTPGTFHFSVLDNGVTSNEFWTIAGVADDLSWIVFHYAGAATAVGQRYLGGLLCTPDGMMPADEKLPEVWNALEKAHIKPWELYVVDNDTQSPGALEAGSPPLTFFRKNVMAAKAKRSSASKD